MLLSKRLLALIICLIMPALALANSPVLNLTQSPIAWLCVVVFVLSYCAVIAEEKLHLRKSKPVMLAASIIWGLIAWLANSHGVDHSDLSSAVTHDLEEYAEMFLFLLVAMTYINAMEERQIFGALRSWLVRRGYSFRQLFWVTSIMAFCISPIADNLTTALLMGAVIMAVGSDHPNFIIIAMTSVVVAANAGGAFSPFGDITTLMVWQAGKVEFFSFFSLFLPSVVNFMVPALIMTFFIDDDVPKAQGDKTLIKRGGRGICLLFLITIGIAVSFENFFGLPPFMGMMAGLSLLMFYIYFINETSVTSSNNAVGCHGKDIDIYERVAHAEWDTLLFFFGIIFSVGGLRYLGYLEWVSKVMYTDLGPTWTNIAAGCISAIIDNIPVMFAILGMNPQMDVFQWLLITLTAGVGGSLLSIGSAAGVALMGASRGSYTFMGHLRWTWAVALGYGASIGMHFLVNG
ncbi:MAG: sodium:proton antiporter NhaD [Candidatus Endonucleobacter bathymodioli]|uniref:Sodium:proton antiporter NhaD n=1 Tax=Candidatus Endonucleibacter bathymodioli TaxID=539814 RepID=A0AA90NVC3_9GAMM|nr:sodium:proton antiporter NhaD [Candidatus Endonucleobacter bathymodioli]